MIRRILTMATALMALGIAPNAHAQAGATDTIWQFRCPAAGTVVEPSTGATLRFRGEDTSQPGNCMMSGNQARLMGYWRVSEGFYRAAGPRLAGAFANGVNLANARPLEFSYFGTGLTGDSIMLDERWTAQAGGAITTPAGTFNTVRVDRYFVVRGSAFQFTESVWFDQATNVPVRARVDHRNFIQAPSLVNWDANEVTRAQTASR